MNTVSTFLLSAGIVGIVLFLAARFDLNKLLLDLPNARSLHVVPTPRYGGVAIAIASIALLMPMGKPASLELILTVSLVLALVSIVDDYRPLPVVLKLFVQIGAATMATMELANPAITSEVAGAARQMDWLFASPAGWCLAIAVIVWMTNLFNFMDGADGLAGGMTCIGFGAFAFAAATNFNPSPVVGISVVLAGSAAGFLLFNFPPATVFMGDVGSIPIGFLSAAIGTYGAVTGLWPWWFAPLVFSAFIVDATATLIRRLLGGEKVWLAHREHYYQRLILSGLSQRTTALSYYFLMLMGAVSALIAQNSQLQYPILTFWVITYSALLWYLKRRFEKNKKVKPDEIHLAK